MTHNESSGQSVEELTDRAVQAIARVWGISEAEARAAIARCRDHEQQHRAVLIDLTDSATRAAYFEKTA